MYLPETFIEMRLFVARILSMFGSTYLCEQLFSILKINETSHRSRLTEEHVRSILAQRITPNINKLVSAKKCQVSGKKY